MSNIKVSSDIDTILRTNTKEQVASFLGLGGKASVGTVTALSTKVDDIQDSIDGLNDFTQTNGESSYINSNAITALSTRVDGHEDNLNQLNDNSAINDNAISENTSLISDNAAALLDKANKASPEFTGSIDLSSYTSTSSATGASALNPVQNYQPATDDTVCNLCVDPSGNVVRGSQEATWTFSREQLNALSTNRTDLLSAPASGQCIVIEETNWLVEVDLTKAYQSTNVNLKCEILGVNANSVGTQIIKDNLNNIAGILKTANDDAVAAGEPATSSFGLYHRDVPDLARIYRFDVPLTIRAVNGQGVANNFPDNFVSVKLKIKYRVFDSTTF